MKLTLRLLIPMNYEHKNLSHYLIIFYYIHSNILILVLSGHIQLTVAEWTPFSVLISS